MRLILQVSNIGATQATDGRRLITFKPAPSVDANDPNMEWTSPGVKPLGELRLLLGPDALAKFPQGSVFEATIDEGEA
jgi:hypothetical protein